jgi:integrase
MILKMKRHASRPDSGFHQIKIRVPTDVVERARGRVLTVDLPAAVSDPACRISFTLGTFCKGSLRTRDAATADVRRLVVVAAFGRLCDALRRGPAALSHEQVIALSGEVYDHLVDEHRANPGTEAEWAAWKGLLRAALEGRVAGAPAIRLETGANAEDVAAAILAFGGGDLTTGIDALPADYDSRALQERCGRLAFWVLGRHGIEVDSETHLRLLRAVARAALDAGWRLKKMAQGDYRPDPAAERFPTFEKAKPAGITMSVVFDRWAAEVKPSPATLSTWRGVLRQFEDHVGAARSVSKITKADVLGWKDALVARGLRPKTINDQHLTALKALLNFAVNNDLVGQNVATGIRLKVQEQAGERMLGYDDDELARLLDHASRETRPARRWLPMLAVYTGARIGELAQLWGSQVAVVDGVPVIEIRPSKDGGRLKTASSERVVPLHRALVEAGFVAFARAKGDAPLFYPKPARRGSEAKHPSKGVSNHLAAWVKSLPGFDDPRKSALHACRHSFKSTGARLEISDSLIDALQGHKDKTTAGGYRHFTVTQMAAAVARYPILTLAKVENDGAVALDDPNVEPAPARSRGLQAAPGFESPR